VYRWVEHPAELELAIEDIEAELEERLGGQQTYTRSLIESNIDALMTTDPLGIITDVNQQMAALTGSSREELIGAPFKTYFTDPALAEEFLFFLQGMFRAHALVTQQGSVSGGSLRFPSPVFLRRTREATAMLWQHVPPGLVIDYVLGSMLP
jgi:PAS domain S-box-containing protein